jgi:FkbH-like protein
LLDLYHRGIILAICSKNNLDDAMAPFQGHAGMLLRSSHFAAMRINWEDKARNLRELAQELNVGLDSMAFLDDDPVERDRVSRQLPEVQIVDLPEEPALYADAIRQCPFFERLTLSQEDKVRSRYYIEEQQRRALQQNATSVEEFYRSLKMEAQICRAKGESIRRIAQLTQKTNQFNLTTRRYSEQQILVMTERPDCRVYSTECRDRFGDNGVVGVAIAQTHGSACEIDTFLLSCRVIGRTLEKAMLAQIAQEARADGIRYLRGWFIPTAKNHPAREFYPSNGFEMVEQASDGRTLWQMDLTQLSPEWPEWIKQRTGVLQ